MRPAVAILLLALPTSALAQNQRTTRADVAGQWEAVKLGFVARLSLQADSTWLLNRGNVLASHGKPWSLSGSTVTLNNGKDTMRIQINGRELQMGLLTFRKSDPSTIVRWADVAGQWEIPAITASVSGRKVSIAWSLSLQADSTWALKRDGVLYNHGKPWSLSGSLIQLEHGIGKYETTMNMQLDGQDLHLGDWTFHKSGTRKR